MELNEALGRSLRKLRLRRGLSQDDFALVTSRTYISQLERGLKSPTIEKIEQFAAFMNIHPASLIIGCYLERSSDEDLQSLFEKVQVDLALDLSTNEGAPGE
ncbi:helix-turn-helix domain-containing protein [Pseudomonas sp. NPDC087342]|uniref:helix-turn-helix domain-containing protein n=1 Tax=Pseudomonas sp. NPDC087342 TaxID=3364437 RepID=UPI0038253A3C